MDPTRGDKMGPARSGWVRRLAPLLVLAAAAGLIVSQGWHHYLTLETIAQHRELLKAFIAENWALALLAYMGVYIVVVALSLPGGAALTLTGGLLFGWLTAGPATIIAATIGATIIFLIAKTSFGEPLAARAGPWLAKLRDGFQEDALNYLLFLRLVPAFPFWLVNLAPALLGVPLRTYVIGTLVGIIPGTMAYAFLGAGLDSVVREAIADQQACLARAAREGGLDCTLSINTSNLVTPELLTALAALGIVAIIPVIARKLRRRRAKG